MMLNMLLPTMEKRYAIAGSAIGALTPMAFATGRLPSGTSVVSFFANLALSPLLVAATLVSATILGFIAARAGRRLDRANRMLSAERLGIAQLYHTAYHDALTGLGNRHALTRDFSTVLGGDSSRSNLGVVMLLDLDRFKYINDTLGHSAGDEVLTTLTRRLRGGCGENCRLYRLGGDEFLALWDDHLTEEEVNSHAVELAEGVFRPVHYIGTEIETSGSIGITFIKNGDALADVLKRADLALYNAKEVMGASHAFFTAEMDRDYASLRAMEKELRAGITGGALRVAYQPIVESGSMVPRAFAAQVRWTHPDHGEVAPELFLALAQETGLIALIDRWMIETVIGDVAGWPNNVTAALSISPEEIVRPGFANHFAEKLSKADVTPDRFIFDINFDEISTRSVRLARENLSTICAMGVKVSTTDYIGEEIDLTKAGRLHVDNWRIDLARLRGSENSDLNYEVACNLVALADSIGMSVRFIGVEDDRDLAFVAGFNKSSAQGNFSGASMTGEQASAYARNLMPREAGAVVLRMGGDTRS